MRNKKPLIFIAFGALLLVACSAPSQSSSNTSSSEQTTTSSIVTTSTSTSTSSSESIKLDGNEKKFKFYCANDFHGAILEGESNKGHEAGIKKYFGELKRLKEEDPEHSILLSAGDMWQGSLESN